MTVWRSFLWAWSLDRCADMLWTTTLAWIAAGASNPAMQGLMLAAALVPHLAVLLFGGAMADKYGSAAVARVTTSAKAAILLVLVLSQPVSTSLVIVAVMAAALGAVDGVHDPAMESWGARIKRPSEQQEAAASEATLWRVAQLIGAALGGWLVGIGAVVAMSAVLVLYVVQRVLLSYMGKKVEGPPASVADGGRAQIAAGLGFLRQQPVLWATMSVQSTCTITTGAVLMLLTPRLIQEQGWPALTYGLVTMCFAAGMAVGAFGVGRMVARRGAGKPAGVPWVGMLFGAACHVPLLLLASDSDRFGPPGVVGTFFVFGVLLGLVGPQLTGFRRQQTPEHYQGVVAAAARLLVLGPEPLGPLVAGIVAAVIGTVATLAGVAAVGIVLPLVAAVAARRVRVAATAD